MMLEVKEQAQITCAEPVPAGQVREQLERILASPTFANADRLSRFLRYIVEQTLEGNATDIKEYAIGVEVFERGSGFDPRSDSVVRVEARRLRSKLRDYYDADDVSNDVRITIPKGSYVPEFNCIPSAPSPLATRHRRRFLPVSLIVGSLAIVAFVWFAVRRLTPTAPEKNIVIAFLPLENLSTDAENGYFCHAISDQIGSLVARNSRARVLTRGPSGPFLAGADLQELATRHSATFAFEGSASFSGHRIRLTVNLVDLRTFSNTWVDTFDSDISDRLNAERELATAIAQAITKRLKLS